MKTGISFISSALLEDFQEDNAENAVKNGFLPHIHYRGLTQPHDPNHNNHITWVSTNAEHASEYANGQGSSFNADKTNTPNITPLYIKSNTPVHLGYRVSTTETTDSELLGRVKNRIMDAYQNKQTDLHTAKKAFDMVDKVPTTNTYNRAWHWRDSIPEVKHSLQMVGYDSFEDTEMHKGEPIKTIGLFDKSQLHPIYKPFK